MTERKIKFALKKIEEARKSGYHLEALIRHYHLNIELIRYLINRSSDEHHLRERKVKLLVKDFLSEHASNPKMKAVIAKKSLKSVKLWISRMDQFFKALKSGQARDIRKLHSDAQHVFTLLNIPASKLFISSRR